MTLPLQPEPVPAPVDRVAMEPRPHARPPRTDIAGPRPSALTLRFRLNLTLAATMLLILGLGFGFAVHEARRSVGEAARATVDLAEQIILAGPPSAGGGPESLAAWLERLSILDRTSTLRIALLGTATPPSPGPNPAKGTPTWFRWLVAPAPIARRVHLREQGATVVIAAAADDEIAEAWEETRGFMLLVLTLAVTVCSLVHVTVGRAFHAVGTILQGLEGIEKGDYGQRLPAFGMPEFQRIASAFNHMAATLQKARDENRALTGQTLGIQEEERRYLARELHDELAQSLTAIKILAAALRHDGTNRQEAATHIVDLCDRLFGGVRAMLRRLRPSSLDELGLSASLEDLVTDWRGRNPRTAVAFDCDPAADECPEPSRIHLFRIVQECLTNVTRHASASQVQILLQHEDSPPCIRLSVRDDGRGFEPSEVAGGFGLAGIRERVASLGGTMAVQSQPGRGTAISVSLPTVGRPA